MLAIDGATVSSVTFAPEGIVVGLRRRFRRLTCPHYPPAVGDGAGGPEFVDGR